MNMEIEKLDIDSIFVKYTINEIRDIEEKIKADMEGKKEELRSMVGERYRELIEAADAIFQMKTCAKGVEQFVHLLNEKCSKIDHTMLNPLMTTSNIVSDKQLSKLTFAISVKLLTETRRQCWMFLEEHNFSAAARQYLLAQYMSASLSATAADEQLDNDSQKAILAATRLWNQTRHMKTTILDKCRLYLKYTDANVEVLANALATLIVFGNKSVEQVLNELLAAKLDIIKESYQNTDLKKSSKSTVRQLLVLLINTIFELDTLFSKNENDNHTHDQLKKYVLSFYNTLNDSHNATTTSILSYGQNHILKMQETFFKNCESIDLTEYESRQKQLVQYAVEQWLQTALQFVQSGMRELLNHVTSLKQLLYLKSSLVSLLTEERMEQWSTVCSRLLNGYKKDIRLWDDLIKNELRTRAKEVLHVRFDQFNQTATEKIQQCLKAYQNSINKNDNSSIEFNTLNYIWSDIDNNIPSDYVWTPASHRIPVGDAKFSLKAVAISMDLQRLCRELDDELRQILDDVSEFSVADGTSTSILSDTSISTTNTNTNSMMYSDSGFVEEHLEECVIRFCSTLLAHLREIANDNEKIGDEEHTLASLVWLGSCARAIPIVSKNLKVSLELVANIPDSANNTVSDRTRATSQTKRTLEKAQKTSWIKAREMFMTTHVDLFKQWIIHICAHVDMHLRNKLSTFLDDIPTLVWNEIEIEESLDIDKTYKSVIRVPLYVTPFIEELLFYSCQEINQALAHGLDKELSSEMSYRFLQTFFNVYESWWLAEDQKRTNKKRLQTRIIQIVYDLRFIHMLLERKDNSATTKDINERFSKLIENVESEIDPFDLNVLSPYMQSNLQKIVSRSSLLFGHMITNDRLVPTKPLPTNNQDTNNILSLSSCSQRFSLLPIATNLSSTSTGQKLSSKGSILKSNTIHGQQQHINNNENTGNDSGIASLRPLTTNVAEVATYYSKWFQNIVK